ncbi:hypothetical protein F6X42_43395 [Paraburkholderia sp. WC7.3b]|uniref:Uncharacterized protein n=1 Tax=Paraburkholderia podalyriae TaxID=1938811 RepID=A0ABR7Q3C1_9BURK|nr:hypothetical protein [Paraburkholderia podalyriae]
MACQNLSGVIVGIAPRATMRIAPDGPKKLHRLQEPFPFSGFPSGRCAVHVIKFQRSQNQIGTR